MFRLEPRYYLHDTVLILNGESDGDTFIPENAEVRLMHTMYLGGEYEPDDPIYVEPLNYDITYYNKDLKCHLSLKRDAGYLDICSIRIKCDKVTYEKRLKAGKRICEAFKRAISDPNYLLCRKRLLAEYSDCPYRPATAAGAETV